MGRAPPKIRPPKRNLVRLKANQGPQGGLNFDPFSQVATGGSNAVSVGIFPIPSLSSGIADHFSDKHASPLTISRGG